MSKVSDASSADGSSGWFKIFQDTWASAGSSSTGSTDFWGTKDLNTCCGKMNVKIPSDIAAGDYLLRAEVIALHVASSSGGAQFYTSCCTLFAPSFLSLFFQHPNTNPPSPDQLTVSGSGSASPATVKFPGAYSASDPGILINIYQHLSTYIAPGPSVYSGGSTRSAGAACSGAENSQAGASATGGSGSSGSSPTTTFVTTSKAGSTSTAASSSAAATGACAVARYGQCGGNTYGGCTTCESGLTCSAVSPPYYSQCM
jgi:lytic cellulose monooxygenase (C1-hydroxylating)